MIKNYFKIAYRNLLKYKGFTLINLTGMSLGLTISILILIFVKHELSFDNFHEKGNRIYRITSSFFDVKTGVSQGNLETNGWAVGQTLKNSFEEIEEVVYSRSAKGLKINIDGQKKEENLQYFSASFF